MEQKQNRYKMTKRQTNTFSKYREDNQRNFDINHTHIIKGPYNKQ